jgi:UDP-N-acetyl-D-mannosaminuronate dehydrogenase
VNPSSTPDRKKRGRMIHDKGSRIAVIGLGAMGLPMATRLGTTFTVTGFEPYAPRREQAEQAGLHAASTPAATCAAVDIAAPVPSCSPIAVRA